MKVLVTGATGFVGRYLCHAAIDLHYSVRVIVRPSADLSQLPPGVDIVSVDSILEPLPESAFFAVDTIIHLAARVHVMRDKSNDPLAANREINTTATLSLARQAAQHGVKRFIYLSSIKVNGEGGINLHQSYTEKDIPQPIDPYGQSKWEAEQGLAQIAAETGLEIVIIRPPLVYGRQVKGNFQQLLRIIERGIPLPFGRIKNARSLVYVGNLVDAILRCVTHPAARNQTFIVSDGEDLSTPELIRRLATWSQKSLTLLPIPPQLLILLGKLTNQTTTIDKLLGSLTVDITHIQTTLDWKPPFTVDEGLRETVK